MVDEEDDEWMPIFFPKDFIGSNMGITLENYTLDNDTLLQFAKRVTIIRKNIRDKAERVAREFGENTQLSKEQLQQAIKKIQNRRATRT